MQFKIIIFLSMASQLVFGLVSATSNPTPGIYQGNRKHLGPRYFSNYAVPGIDPNGIPTSRSFSYEQEYAPFYAPLDYYDSSPVECCDSKVVRVYSDRNLYIPCIPFNRNSFEVRFAALFPTSDRFREIYDEVSPSFQFEGSTEFNRCFDGWVNFDWVGKNGRSKGLHSHTKVRISNLSFGIKFLYPLCNCFTGYIGIGPSIGWIKIKNRSCCSHHKESKSAFGGILKTGVYYYITRCIYLDLFVDYLYQPVHFKKKDRDIGGIKTGLGIGATF